MSTSYASLFGRLRFGLARRLLYFWARSSRIGDSNEELAIDPQQPVIYVLPYRSLTDLIVADRECVKAGLPRPVRAPLPPLDERDAFIFLSRERSWVGRPDPRGQSPRLGKVLEHPESVQLIPITVFWGQSPDSESSAINTASPGGGIRRSPSLRRIPITMMPRLRRSISASLPVRLSSTLMTKSALLATGNPTCCP